MAFSRFCGKIGADFVKRGNTMAKKQKEIKTNVMRILDKAHIPYESLTYECDEFIDGLHTAEITGAPVECTLKTLILVGKSGEHYVFVIPIAEELDLKKCAASVGEKSLSMLPPKDLLKVSGYVRGGCSPVGMKKLFTTKIEASAKDFPEVYISGGRVGSSIKLSPLALAELIGAEFTDLLAE